MLILNIRATFQRPTLVRVNSGQSGGGVFAVYL